MYDTIVTAPGSLGDANPMIAIARGLQAQGRRVVVAIAERYMPLVERAGLGSRMLVSEIEFGKVVNNPDLWHPRKGVKLVFQAVSKKRMHEHYAWIESLYQPGKTICISHMLDFAGRIFRDAHPESKFCSVLPEPVLLRSKTAPPRMSHLGWETKFPTAMLGPFYRLVDWYLDRMVGPSINQLRQQVGLPKVRRVLDQWWASPDLTLGTFPEWFTVPKADWPANFQCTGFPLADAGDLLAEPADELIRHALAPLSGARPIVFAPGSAHAHAKTFLTAGAAACQRLKLPGVLLSREADQFPDQLPPGVVTASYLPFRELMPHALAIVHHGGIGTTSQTLAAGLPQVVCPMAFDQFDNGSIVEKIGCGIMLPMLKANAENLTAALTRVLHSTTAATTAHYQKQVLEQWASPERLAQRVLSLA